MKNVTYLSPEVFKGSNIEQLNLSNVTTLHSDDFVSCKNLKSIDFGNKIERIPEGCFMWCDSLEEIYLPEQIIGISTNAFCHCQSLKKVVIAGDVFAVLEHLSNMFTSCSPDLVIYCNDSLIDDELFQMKYIDNEKDMPNIEVYRLDDLNNPDAKSVIKSRSSNTSQTHKL